MDAAQRHLGRPARRDGALGVFDKVEASSPHNDIPPVEPTFAKGKDRPAAVDRLGRPSLAGRSGRILAKARLFLPRPRGLRNMTTPGENELLTQIGPGTPMGAL